jgi:hypothetical protein
MHVTVCISFSIATSIEGMAIAGNSCPESDSTALNQACRFSLRARRWQEHNTNAQPFTDSAAVKSGCRPAGRLLVPSIRDTEAGIRPRL